MPSKYNPQKIEKKWQKEWQKNKLYRAVDGSKKKKYYTLVEFPYPSGDGLHVGHVRSYTALDVVVRKRRMEGYNVLYPIGWDAFGLPTENYAIKTQTHPKIVTKKNTDNFRRQLQSLGFSFDWDREINTTDPQYYKWTQWLFLKFFEHGLAYKARTTINWCPKDKIGLANEEVVSGACERCGTAVEKREKEQWMLRITAYAEKLLKGLEKVDYIPEARVQQENWIGKSEGAVIKFPINIAEVGLPHIEVFTTRADTLFGATYLVLAPEHEFIQKYESRITNYGEVKKYISEARKKTDMERTAEGKEKTGVELKGIMAVNPATKKEIPVWISDYVLAGYGTGAIMAVPAHDERDFAFAKKFGLDIVLVIQPHNIPGVSDLVDGEEKLNRILHLDIAYTGEGRLMNSGKFNHLKGEEARTAITNFVGGKITTQYKLRDWVFSRQRYWGEPIPLVFCKRCKESGLGSSASKLREGLPLSKGEALHPGWIPVREKDLPVELPNVKNYKPTDTGESPLANISSWVKTTCPRCGGPARRETDVMPNWAGSSWYFLRYIDSKNKRAFADAKKLKHWMPVDWYNGGMEHTVLHLLYSRFWNQFLYDIKLVPVAEPYKKRTSHGLILAEGGVKMSKSKGNVINPDEVVRQFGADALRLYEMFVGPFNQHVSWDPHGIIGTKRFLERVWKLGGKLKVKGQKIKYKSENKKLDQVLHQTIKKVSEDIENLRMNTAVSSLMILLNEMEKEQENIQHTTYNLFLKLLAPFAPHIVEELWGVLGEKKSIHTQPWPRFDKKKAQEDVFGLVVQINGKVRAVINTSTGISQNEAERLVLLSDERVIKTLDGKKLRRVIYVPDKLINFVF